MASSKLRQAIGLYFEQDKFSHFVKSIYHTVASTRLGKLAPYFCYHTIVPNGTLLNY